MLTLVDHGEAEEMSSKPCCDAEMMGYCVQCRTLNKYTTKL